MGIFDAIFVFLLMYITTIVPPAERQGRETTLVSIMKSNASYVVLLLKNKSLNSKTICLGDPNLEKVFSGSLEDLENIAQKLYSSPPHLQHLNLEALSIKMPQNVLPTPGIALQHKIEKSVGSQLNIQLQEQMGV